MSSLRAHAALLLAVPSLIACGTKGDPLGQAQAALTVCPGATMLNGVDVSHYDGTVDWPTTKAGGISFAFAKATEGTTYTDDTFAANWSGMKSAKITRGAYHFFHSTDDVTTQVDLYLSTVGTFSPGDLPPTLDLEVTDGSDPATVTSTAIAWLDAVAAKTGTKPILYASPDFITSDMGSPAGLEDHAILWLANYGVTCPDVPAPYTSWVIWQSSSTGTVSGVPGSAGMCDLDVFDGDAAALAAITVGGSGSAGSSTSTSSAGSSSGSSAPSCQVDGVDGTCIDTSVCATMTGYVATPGFCPGPADEQCCTPTASATTSSSSGSGGASSSSSSAGGGAGGAGTSGTGGSTASGTGSSSGGTGAGVTSSSASSSTGTGAQSSGGLLKLPGASSGCAVGARGGEEGRGWSGPALALACAVLAYARSRRATREPLRTAA